MTAERDGRRKYLGMYPKEIVYICAIITFGLGVVCIVVRLLWLSIIPFAVAIVLIVVAQRLRRNEYRKPDD